MVVYADVLFAINLAVDYLILWAVGKLARCKARWRWLLAGAAVMALAYCLVVLVLPFQAYYSLFSSLLMVMAGVTLAFRPHGVKVFLMLVGLCYACALVIGGTGMALYYCTSLPQIIRVLIGGSVGAFSIWLLLAASAGFFILIKLGQTLVRRHLVQRQLFLPVTVIWEDKTASFPALVDTGNSLRDPLSQAPVIIAEFDSVRDFLPENFRRAFAEKQESNLTGLLSGAEDTALYARLRMIPFESLGRRNGILVGFRPDLVEVQVEETKKKLIFSHVIVGISPQKLSASGAYHGLISPELAHAHA